MKIIKKSNKKIILTVSTALVIVMIGILLYVFAYKSEQTNSNKSGGIDVETFEPTESDINQSQQLQTNMDGKKASPNTDQPATPTQDTGSTKQKVNVSASVDVSNNSVYIRGGMNYPVQDGSCHVQLTGPSGQSIGKDTTILQNPASADCKTITIPTADLSSGTWKFTLQYSSDKYEGASSEVTFSI
jgi:hypothetical protein